MLPVGAMPVRSAGAVPEQIAWLAAIDPAVSGGLTVIVTVLVGNGPPQVPEAFCNCLK